MAVPVFLVSFCVGTPGYYSGKYASAGPAHPRMFPYRAAPEQQTEPHTCGMHAISSLYHAYGLDPERLNVRFRIGVDKPVSNLLPDSLGTIHPDIFRVLGQDGFDTELLRAGADDTRQRIADHLDSGHFALVLVRVTELHWVLLTGREGDSVEVCDSLEPEVYAVPFASYVNERVHSVVLIQPR